MSRATCRGLVVGVLVLAASPTRAAEIADLVGQTVVAVQLFRDGQATQDRIDLVETKPGLPLSMREVRESETHLFSLGGVDVRVSAIEDPGGVVLRYDLIPLQAAVEVEIRGSLGRSRPELLAQIAQRFGRTVGADQTRDVVTFLEELYRASGRYAARITARTGPAGSRLLFDIDQGPPARTRRIDLLGVPEARRASVLARLGLELGGVFDPGEVETRLEEYQADVRARRYYEASFRYQATPSPDGLAVDVVVDAEIGPRVTILFTVDGGAPVAMESDPLPDVPVVELVPVAREGSVDEDLLEDSGLRVEASLRRRGYQNARVTHQRRRDQPGELSIEFEVDRGAAYRVADVRFVGNRSVADPGALFGVAAGMPLVVADVEAGVAVLTERYRQLGYRAVAVAWAGLDAAPAGADDPSAVVPVSLAIEIDEGLRTTVGEVIFTGNTAFSAAELHAVVASAAGEPFYAPRVADDSAALRVHYLNEGYETVRVTAEPAFDETGTTATLTFAIRGGQQVLVEHVLVVGNRQIGASTVLEELTLRPGEPLGLDEVDETRRRLTALGLFRGYEIRQFSHGDPNRRDVVVVVDEAAATRVGYGGGIELSQRLRASAGGAAREQLELAPRGFFEIGRRNLWGKNRSINLLTRVSVRRQDDTEAEVPESSLGFNEYRVLLNYREPRAFGQSGALSVSGFVQQVIRPSFDLFSRGVVAELRRAVGFNMTGSVGYSYGQNRVTNAQLQPEDVPLVDRLFPEVTLSIVSSGLTRDTRDDPLDPTGGSLVGVDGEFAFRFIGSEVGFAKTTFQGSLYRRLPRDLVFAAGARLGLARGFELTFPSVLPTFVVNDDGFKVQLDGEAVKDLPASERFFAGGDTGPVRGFALDQLGDDATIDENGFPTGGNAMIVLNSELRVPVTGALQVVGFLDAGNVFDQVSNLRLGRIRSAAGFGVRYRSPVGPIRVDLGFKLDRREFGDQEESLTALHVSIGQAF